MSYVKGYLNSRIKYHGRKNTRISGKFSFVGMGLMGSRVVDTIAQLKDSEDRPYYPTLAINTNVQDLDSIENCKNKLALKGYERGAGRDPRIGYKALVENEAEVKSRLKHIASDQDMVFIIAGLGGGTGTGSILSIMKWASEIQEYFGVNFGLIISIPRKRDKRVENENALAVLAKLNDIVSELPIIIIDNELLYNEYKAKREKGEIGPGIDWTSDSNLTVASLIHQLNLITSFKPYGNKHFDGQELLRVLNVGGCITFARADLTLSEFKDNNALIAKILESIDNGVVAGGYNYKAEAKSIGFSVISPANKSDQVLDILAMEALEDSINKLLPHADTFWGTYIDQNETDKVYVFSVISGMGLPNRIEEIVEYVRTSNNTETRIKYLDIGEVNLSQKLKPKTLDIDNPFDQEENNSFKGGATDLDFEDEKTAKNPGLNLKNIPAWLE
ncbi:MAG: hypothetical protein APF76_04720 [Desulfitibacter sp. BRH_c19]|nr:MAG: hypothetical protein APF76_04720 [Desulfitibacter sp. BRH_c19]